jgi:iron complex outermembrane receptor protein
MRIDKNGLAKIVAPFILLASGPDVFAQASGVLRGTVRLADNGGPLHHASVLLVQLGQTTETRPDGTYEFTGLPPGQYDVVAHMHPLTDLRKTVEIPPEGTAELDFELRIAPVHEEITVTASGKEQTTLEAFQSVLTLEQLDLASKSAVSLGEALERETGVAKRSSGPGTSRPVVRGFDGDRVLILQDGIPTGTLSSQSGDHGEPVDLNSTERVEVVRGPATLLYGTNAIGGVVNVLTNHHQIHQHPHEGVRGFLTGTGGSNNALGGGNGGFEFGKGKWLFAATGGGMRTGDYCVPTGTVVNSETESRNAAGSAGWYGNHGFIHVGYGVAEGRYGIPVAPEGLEHEEEEGPVDLKWRRHNLRFTGGYRDLASFLDRLTLNLNYSDWNHKELVEEQVGTEFFNRQFVYRAVFDQKPAGKLSGSFGVSGQHRSYEVQGEEQLTPPVTQNAFAVFGLEEIVLERFRVQFGGRLENNRFDPAGLEARSFTGFSGSAGVNVPLWRDGAFVAAYSHSYRAPAIEELYNYGPHHGNLAFEIGNPRLGRERSDGIDLSYRHRASRVRGEVNFFYYRLGDYIYLAPTGAFEEGLVVANYEQSDSRYTGAEARLDVALHPNLWLKLGFDSVDAQLRESKIPLPRIPPVRGRVGIDARLGGLSVRPELVLAGPQDQLYFNETRTAGYGLLDLNASYTVARQHVLHVLSATLFNASDRLYRNHVSLIKEFAPEIGRGFRIAYTVRFF